MIIEKFFRFATLITLSFVLISAVFSQTTSRKTRAKTVPAKTVSTTPDVPPKKNARPEDTVESPTSTTSEPQKKNQPRSAKAAKPTQNKSYSYFFEFTQPDFTVRKMILEHDESGKGILTFEKQGWDETLTDPVELSATSLERINKLFTALNFLDSTENYQSERHYAHLGVMKIRRKSGEKSREVTLDWSDNKDAKALADEYRKVCDQFVWIFDVKLARENQPLEAPKLIGSLETMIKQKWISDPMQLVPFLKELGNDERIPLIGRNRAMKIAKEIEKTAEKN